MISDRRAFSSRVGAKVVPFVALLCFLSGCEHTRAAKSVSTEPVVLSVAIKGTQKLRPEEIRPRLGQRATHPLHWIPLLNFIYPRHFLNEEASQGDRVRIANIYARSGFFDARVVDSETETLGERKDGTRARVKIIHTVEEGSESLVRSAGVALVHSSGTPLRMGFDEIQELEEAIGSVLGVAVGDRFSMQKVEESEQAIRDLLAERSFAFALVSSTIDAFPEEQAVDVSFVVSPGNKAVFGEVNIQGLETVAERYVRRHIKFQPSQVFDGRKVRATQQALFKMGTFSLVTVSPALEVQQEIDAEGRAVVPVDIILRERKPRTFRGGGGLGWSRGSFDVHGAASISHINLFRRLVRLELDVEGGFVYLGPEDLGPGGHAKLDIRWPDFPVRSLTVYATGGVETDVRPGYKYVQPEGDLGAVWEPWKHLRLSLSYNVSYFSLYDNRLEDLTQVEVGNVSFDDGYFLSLLRQQVVLDLRDNLLAPNRGLLFSAVVDEAGGGLGGRYRYVKVTGDLRGYVPLISSRLVLGMRAWASYVHTWGDQEDVPIQEAVFAGGDGSVRGWKTGYLGPRAVESDCDRSDCILPLGGKLGTVASIELRGRPVGGLWIAGFCDFGRVWSEADDIADAAAFFAGLQPSFGGGIRYDLSVGRIRLDVAVHPLGLTDEMFREAAYLPPCLRPGGCGDRAYRELPNWNFHIGFGESF
jgi:outer membrane protein assembly factor BamA